MRNDKVIEAGNGLINDDEVPMTVFQLSQPIRSTILNYSKFVSTLDLTAFQNNPGSIPCACSSFDNKFCDPDHKHIITGDLNIIQNTKLRDLIGKGPNFREPQKVKAVGGVRGVFCMLGSYESAAPYVVSAFYRLLISRSVLEIRPVKAIGGVRGVFCMLGSYKSAAPYGTSAFYRLLISRSVLKICSVKVRPRTPK